MPSSLTPTPLKGYSDLLAYQQDAIDFLYTHDAGIIQAKMGAGKHVIAQTAAQELIQDEVLSRVLVVTTPRVRDHVWAVEHREWEHLWEPAIATGTPQQRKRILRGDERRIVVISLDVLPWAAKLPLAKLFDGFVIDELTKVKAPTGARIAAMREHLPHFKWRAGLTGTLGGDGKIEDVFGQVQWFSGCLGRNVTTFRQRYETLVDKEYHRYAPQPGAWGRMIERIRPLVHKVDDDAYERSLPPIVVEPIKVTLPARARVTYNRMARTGVVEVEGHRIIAEDAGAEAQKLRQIASGFIYDKPDTYRLHQAKLDAFEDLVESMDTPLIAAYQYTAELEMMRERCPGPCMGSGETVDVDAWNRGEIPLLYMHPRSAAHGLNLQQGGNSVVFFAQTWSRDDHDQLIARVRRRGQTSAQVLCYYIIADNTDDERIVASVRAKQKAEVDLLKKL